MAKKKEEVVTTKDTNVVTFTGTVKYVNVLKDKMASYNVQIATPTPKGNTSYCWVDVVDFQRVINFEEGDRVKVIGQLNTNSYDDKYKKKVYQLRVVATELTEFDSKALPFE